MQVSFLDTQKLLLLIDENLADLVLAEALTLVGYNAKSVRRLLGAGTEDPILINWLGIQRGIWITTDQKAKSEHFKDIKKAGIHIIWVRPPRHLQFSKKTQLLLLLWVIDPILQEIAKVKGPAQFLAYYSGSRPKYKRL